MKTIEITLYNFDELSDKAKETAIENNAFINVKDDAWYSAIDEDAENIGLVIKNFDIEKYDITVTFGYNAEYTARAIERDHGENCNTYKLAQRWLYGSAYENGRFLNDLASEYFYMLEAEYERLTTKEAIADTLRKSDFDFTGDGKIYHTKQ